MSSQRSGHRQLTVRDEVELPAPRDLEVSRFEIGPDEYAVLSFSIVKPHVPSVLTHAEQSVARHVLEGRSNAQIAAARKTSKPTVANQLQAIYDKLGISGRAELISLCVARHNPDEQLLTGR